MNHSGHFSFVEWSNGDQAFVGYCPSLFTGGVCHAETEEATRTRLDALIIEEIESLKAAQPIIAH